LYSPTDMITLVTPTQVREKIVLCYGAIVRLYIVKILVLLDRKSGNFNY
jgi:hypothetical protein